MTTKLRRPTASLVPGGPPAGAPLELSVVIPIYNEEANVPLLHEQVTAALKSLGRSYEIVYVDDGSSDRSSERLAALAQADRAVRVVRFRRNFGQTAALQAGIEWSTGEVLVFMDGDLQNDPADITHLLAKLEEGFDLVSGWRKKRQDDLFRTFPSRIANWLISRVTGVHLNDYGCTLKAYRRSVLDPIRLYGEMHRFIPAYAAWAGARITEIPVNHRARRFGKSKYGLSRTLRVLLDLMTVKLVAGYATKPIYFFGFIGFGLWILSGLATIEVLFEKLLPPHTYVHNNPMFTIAVFLAIVGVQFIMMGLLAELSIRTYHESQGKPTYMVLEVLEGGAAAPKPESS